MQRALARAYGDDAVHLDYGDRIADPRSAVNIDPEGFFSAAAASGYAFTGGKQVVHGHFHIRKYDRYPRPCRRITFLRHPVDQTFSLYYFWRQLARTGHTLQDYLLDNDLDIVAFAKLPFIRHFYEGLYFSGVDRRAFDFVGSVEHFDRDVGRLSHLLGRRLDPAVLNVGPRGTAPAGDAAARKQVAAIRQDDIAFYRDWCGL